MNQNQLIRKHVNTGGLHKIAKILDLNQIGFFKICKIKTVRDVGSGTEWYPPAEIYDSDSESEMTITQRRYQPAIFLLIGVQNAII